MKLLGEYAELSSPQSFGSRGGVVGVAAVFVFVVAFAIVALSVAFFFSTVSLLFVITCFLLFFQMFCKIWKYTCYFQKNTLLRVIPTMTYHGEDHIDTWQVGNNSFQLMRIQRIHVLLLCILRCAATAEAAAEAAAAGCCC